MATMSISLSDQMRSFVKSRVESGDFHNESEYIRNLVRQDREKLSQEQALIQLLKQSEKSGMSDLTIPDIMDSVKGRLRKNGQI